MLLTGQLPEVNKMSLDLSMIPLDEGREGIIKMSDLIHPRTVLAFKQNFYSIAAQLHQIDTRPPPCIVPYSFTPHPHSPKICLALYEDEGERLIDKDDIFGEPLTFVYAEQLRGLDVGDDPHHKAIKAYIDALPDETRIVLYWS
jgi:hypothetical protein